MYPLLREGVSLGTYYDEDEDKEDFFVENSQGNFYSVTKELFNALLVADGMHPWDETDLMDDELIRKLKKAGIIQTNRFVWSGLINQFVIVPVVRPDKHMCQYFCILNKLLPKAACLLLVAGIFCKILIPGNSDAEMSWFIYCISIFLSISMHELAHASAAIAYGEEVSNVGILLLGILPIGAFVCCNEHACSRKERLQISLAGIEMNLLIGGVSLILSCLIPEMELTCFVIAALNIGSAVFNMIPTSGMDGEGALSAIFDVENFGKTAKECLYNRKKREQFMRGGVKGFFCLGLFVFNCFVGKGLVMLLYIYEIVCIFWIALG